jgi:hypothetical protein
MAGVAVCGDENRRTWAPDTEGPASAEAWASSGPSFRDFVMSPCDLGTSQAGRAGHRRIRRVGNPPRTANDGRAFSTPACACPARIVQQQCYAASAGDNDS